jgi:hypothetical protein
MAQRGVVGDGFQIVALPAMKERARFLVEKFVAGHLQTYREVTYVPPIHSHREIEGRQDGNHAQRIRHWRKKHETKL